MPIRVRSTFYGLDTEAKTFEDIMDLPEGEEGSFSDLIDMAAKIDMTEANIASNPAFVGSLTKHTINNVQSVGMTGSAPEIFELPNTLADDAAVTASLYTYSFDEDGLAVADTGAMNRLLLPCHVWDPVAMNTGDEILLDGIKEKRLDEPAFQSETFYKGYLPNGLDFQTVQYFQNSAQTYESGGQNGKVDLFTSLTKILAYGLSWLIEPIATEQTGVFKALHSFADGALPQANRCTLIPNTMWANYFPRHKTQAPAQITLGFYDRISSIPITDAGSTTVALPANMGSSAIAMWLLGIAPYPVMAINNACSTAFTGSGSAIGAWVKVAQQCHAINGPTTKINVIVGTSGKPVFTGPVANTLQANIALVTNTNPSGVQVTYDLGAFLHTWLGSSGFGKTLVAQAHDWAVSKLGAGEAYNKAMRMALLMQVAYQPGQMVNMDANEQITVNNGTDGMRWNWLTSSINLSPSSWGLMSPWGISFRAFDDEGAANAGLYAWIHGPRKKLEIPRTNYANFSLLMCGAGKIKNPVVTKRDLITDTGLRAAATLAARIAFAGTEALLDRIGLNIYTWDAWDHHNSADVRLNAIFFADDDGTDGFQSIVQDFSERVAKMKIFPQDRTKIRAPYRGFGYCGALYRNSTVVMNRLAKPCYLDPSHFEFLKRITNPILGYVAMSGVLTLRASWVPTTNMSPVIWTIGYTFNDKDQRASLFYQPNSHAMSKWYTDPGFSWNMQCIIKRVGIANISGTLPGQQGVAALNRAIRCVRITFQYNNAANMVPNTRMVCTSSDNIAASWGAAFAEALSVNNGSVITMAFDYYMAYLLPSPATTFFAVDEALDNVMANFKRKPAQSSLPNNEPKRQKGGGKAEEDSGDSKSS